MHTITQVEAALAVPPHTGPRWHILTRVAFRFAAVYFTLYILATQMYHSLFVTRWERLPFLGNDQTLQNVTTWVAIRVLGFESVPVGMTGSGDRPYDWALTCTLLAVAAAATLLWSSVDRRRGSYVGLQKWFRVFLRFGLGGTMVTYGIVKAFPLQMSYPNLTRLLEPYGHFSLMGVLWAQIGASPAYEMFTGIVELTCGILLFIPGRAVAGALLTLAATTQVFMLNMTYDVPVKLFSFHLVLMSLVLLAPDLKRLLNFIVLNRPAGPSTEPPLVRNRIGRWIAVTAQLALGAWLVWNGTDNALEAYRGRGPGAPKPPLYGIWNVDTMTIDGQVRSPLVTDYDRWRRVVVQNGVSISFQRMDDTFTTYGAKVDEGAGTITLAGGGPGQRPAASAPTEAGVLTFERPSPDRLTLDGEMDGRKVRMELKYYDRENFRLVQGRFRWVQQTPFNR